MIDLLSSTPTISVTQDREYFTLHFPADPKWVEQIKQRLPGIHKDRERGHWLAPVNSANADVLRTASAFTWTEAARNAAANIYLLEAMRIEASKAAGAELEIPGFGKPPYPYQKAGILYALDRKRVIIGDPMGLGKTIQGLGTIEVAQAYPAVIVVPASLTVNWAENEVPDCLPHRKVVLAGKKTAPLLLRMADIIVTNYEQLVGIRSYRNSEGKLTRTSFTDSTKKDVIPSQLLEELIKLPLRAGIWDEAHKLKDGSTANTMASRELRKGLDFRLLLSGTPMLNQESEFASLLTFLDRLEEFGGWYHFMTYWCGMQKTKNIGWQATTSNAERRLELNQRLRASCYIRRDKAEVLPDLPEKTRGHVLVEIDNWEEYRKAENDLINWVRDQVRKNQEFMLSISHLDPRERERAIIERQEEKAAAAERGEQMVRIQALKDVAGRGKLKAAKEWIQNFHETDRNEKVVVFATHKKVLNQLLAWFPSAARIVSADDKYTRQANVKRFQQDPDCWLLIGAMGTSATNSPAGVGHTLTAASTTLTLELGWNPALHDQCEDRCHRIGQLSHCTNYYMLGRATIDLDTSELIESKRNICRQAADGIEGDEEASILDELMNRIARKATS
ncbi:MAG TPA: DEAD/DEAH box helicase [Candidatus Obscuribacterales bacterium]